MLAAGKLHRFFASLRMTIALNMSTLRGSSFAYRPSLDSPFVQLALKNPLHVYRRRVNLISIQLAHIHQMFYLRNRYFCRRRHHGIEISRRLAVHQISQPVALPRLDESEIRRESAFHQIGPPVELAVLLSLRHDSA